MLRVLVDTSVWIDYFASARSSMVLDALIDDNLVCTNDLILAELIPYLKMRRQAKVVRLLETVNRVPLTIDWQEIVEMQLKCLRSGSNGIGIPDLIIAQNARVNHCAIFSLDKHFRLMTGAFKLELFA